MENQVGLEAIKLLLTPSCGTCSHRQPNEVYETCTVLAHKNWQRDGKVPPILPFWAHGPQATRQVLVPDMTVRTLSSEGRNCHAYISSIA